MEVKFSNTSSMFQTDRLFSFTTSQYDESISGIGMVEFFDRMDVMLGDSDYDELIKGVDVALEKYLPVLNGMLRIGLLLLKSKCLEEMGQFDLALVEIEKAITELGASSVVISDVLSELNLEVSLMDYLEQRRAAILLLSGRECEGISFLRANQPTQIAGVLLYHLIEKEKGVSILVPKPLFSGEEDDLRALFFAGKYEEVVEKCANFENTTYDSSWDSSSFFEPDDTECLRAAALAMLGRGDEACDYAKQALLPWISNEQSQIYWVVEGLNGNREYLDKDWPVFEDFLQNGIPLAPFAKWLY